MNLVAWAVDVEYVLDSCAWSVVCFFVGYLLGLIHRNLHDLWKKDPR